ncbi:MAG: cupin domain-containing protein [Gammaproteobacteria bacterium]|nr:cupin domain-containing protein [Gammaproteobacteria bacterium]
MSELPIGVAIDAATGKVSPASGKYVKRLSELREIYQDKAALDRAVVSLKDPIAYEVVEYRPPNSDITFGTTTMYPGDIAGECYMTRGHFHVRRDMGEVYYTQSGHGLLLLESRDGDVSIVEMKPGVCAYIPPDWAHRSINTGSEPLVFVWVCNPAAGHEYGDILKRGMRKLVMKGHNGPDVVDNAAHA